MEQPREYSFESEKPRDYSFGSDMPGTMGRQPVADLRPMGMGDLLDRTFTFYRRHFLPLIGIVAILVLPVTFLQLVLTGGASFLESDMMQEILSGGEGGFEALLGAGAIFFLLIAFISNLFLSPLAIGALSLGVAQGVIGGAPRLSMGALLGQSLRAIPRLAGAILLTILLLLIFLIAVVIPPLGLALMMFANTAWLILPQVVVLEGVSPWRGLTRSWNLVSQSFWRVFGYNMLLILLSMVITGLPSAVLGFLSVTLATISPFLGQVVQSLGAGMASLLWTPFYLVAMTLLYFDLRVRHEGLDLAVQTEALSGDPLAALSPPPPPDAPWFTSDALRALGILAAGWTALFVFICGCVFLVVFLGEALGSS